MAPSDDSDESVATSDNLPEPRAEGLPEADGGETLAEKARKARPVRKQAATDAKGAPTARRRSPLAVADRPTGPAQFVGESVAELKKVVWPTWSQVQQFFWAVLVFVLIVIAYVGLLDLGFGWVMLRLFGEG